MKKILWFLVFILFFGIVAAGAAEELVAKYHGNISIGGWVDGDELLGENGGFGLRVRSSGTGLYAVGKWGAGVIGSGESSGIEGYCTYLGSAVSGHNLHTKSKGYLGGVGIGVFGTGETYGVFGGSADGDGVYGKAFTSHKAGVRGIGGWGYGVYGEIDSSRGTAAVVGHDTASGDLFPEYAGVGVYGQGKSIGVFGRGKTEGVLGKSVDGTGVVGQSDNWNGIYGSTSNPNHAGVWGTNTTGIGVYGESTATSDTGHPGVKGYSKLGFGILGVSETPYIAGVFGLNNTLGGIGVEGNNTSLSGDGIGAKGYSTTGIGVSGQSESGLSGKFFGGKGVSIDKALRLVPRNDYPEDPEEGTLIVYKYNTTKQLRIFLNDQWRTLIEVQ